MTGCHYIKLIMTIKKSSFQGQSLVLTFVKLNNFFVWKCSSIRFAAYLLLFWQHLIAEMFLEFQNLEENRMSAKWVICLKSCNSRYALVENNKISFNSNLMISRFLWKINNFYRKWFCYHYWAHFVSYWEKQRH